MNSNEPRPDPQANLDAIASNIEARKAEVSQLKARLNELESNPSSSLLERHEAYTQ